MTGRHDHFREFDSTGKGGASYQNLMKEFDNLFSKDTKFFTYQKLRELASLYDTKLVARGHMTIDIDKHNRPVYNSRTFLESHEFNGPIVQVDSNGLLIWLLVILFFVILSLFLCTLYYDCSEIEWGKWGSFSCKRCKKDCRKKTKNTKRAIADYFRDSDVQKPVVEPENKSEAKDKTVDDPSKTKEEAPKPARTSERPSLMSTISNRMKKALRKVSNRKEKPDSHKSKARTKIEKDSLGSYVPVSNKSDDDSDSGDSKPSAKPKRKEKAGSLIEEDTNSLPSEPRQKRKDKKPKNELSPRVRKAPEVAKKDNVQDLLSDTRSRDQVEKIKSKVVPDRKLNANLSSFTQDSRHSSDNDVTNDPIELSRRSETKKSSGVPSIGSGKKVDDGHKKSNRSQRSSSRKSLAVDENDLKLLEPLMNDGTDLIDPFLQEKISNQEKDEPETAEVQKTSAGPDEEIKSENEPETAKDSDVSEDQIEPSTNKFNELKPETNLDKTELSPESVKASIGSGTKSQTSTEEEPQQKTDVEKNSKKSNEEKSPSILKDSTSKNENKLLKAENETVDPNETEFIEQESEKPQEPDALSGTQSKADEKPSSVKDISDGPKNPSKDSIKPNLNRTKSKASEDLANLSELKGSYQGSLKPDSFSHSITGSEAPDQENKVSGSLRSSEISNDLNDEQKKGSSIGYKPSSQKRLSSKRSNVPTQKSVASIGSNVNSGSTVDTHYDADAESEELPVLDSLDKINAATTNDPDEMSESIDQSRDLKSRKIAPTITTTNESDPEGSPDDSKKVTELQEFLRTSKPSKKSTNSKPSDVLSSPTFTVLSGNDGSKSKNSIENTGSRSSSIKKSLLGTQTSDSHSGSTQKASFSFPGSTTDEMPSDSPKESVGPETTLSPEGGRSRSFNSRTDDSGTSKSPENKASKKSKRSKKSKSKKRKKNKSRSQSSNDEDQSKSKKKKKKSKKQKQEATEKSENSDLIDLSDHISSKNSSLEEEISEAPDLGSASQKSLSAENKSGSEKSSSKLPIKSYHLASESSSMQPLEDVKESKPIQLSGSKEKLSENSVENDPDEDDVTKESASDDVTNPFMEAMQAEDDVTEEKNEYDEAVKDSDAQADDNAVDDVTDLNTDKNDDATNDPTEVSRSNQTKKTSTIPSMGAGTIEDEEPKFSAKSQRSSSRKSSAPAKDDITKEETEGESESKLNDYVTNEEVDDAVDPTSDEEPSNELTDDPTKTYLLNNDDAIEEKEYEDDATTRLSEKDATDSGNNQVIDEARSDQSASIETNKESKDDATHDVEGDKKPTDLSGSVEEKKDDPESTKSSKGSSAFVTQIRFSDEEEPKNAVNVPIDPSDLQKKWLDTATKQSEVSNSTYPSVVQDGSSKGSKISKKSEEEEDIKSHDLKTNEDEDEEGEHKSKKSK